MVEYVYVLVRRDLAPPQICVQAAHAAMESTRIYLAPWAEHPHLVLCGVADERALLQAASRLEKVGIAFYLFREPDIGNQATALASAPTSSLEHRRVFDRYKCLQPSNFVKV